MHTAVASKRETLAELCRRFHVRRLEVFGSAARGDDFDPDRSDADFFAPEHARAAVEAMHEIFKKDTVYIRSGGSIPIVTQFDKDLKIPSIMMGMGLPDDNLHAPNEKFHLPNFYGGIEAIARYLEII